MLIINSVRQPSQAWRLVRLTAFDFDRHRPLDQFFKALVDPKAPQRLRLLIPPTLVHTETMRAIYFTDPTTGYVMRFKGEEIDGVFLQKIFLDRKGPLERLLAAPEPVIKCEL